MAAIDTTRHHFAMQAERDGVPFDLYTMDDDGMPLLSAVCVHGSLFDLYDMLDGATLAEFMGLIDNYEPIREARFERGMDAAASRLLAA